MLQNLLDISVSRETFLEPGISMSERKKGGFPMDTAKSNSGMRTENMVTMNTDLLKDKLNKVYSSMHKAEKKSFSQEGLFEYLWDLKEVALLEGKSSVQLPKNWLDELEQEEGRTQLAINSSATRSN